MEIKQQLAANNSFTAPPSIPPTTPLSTTPLTHSTPNELPRPPQSTPKSALEGQVFFPTSASSRQEENMSTSVVNTSLPALMTTPNSCRGNARSGSFRVPSSSYAQIARSSGKRKFGERVGVSPIELPKKRHPIRDLVSSPAPPSVPPPSSEVGEEEEEREERGGEMETGTPEGERAFGRFGVQRRLFGGRVLSDK